MTVGAGSTVSQPGEGSGVALIDTTITAGTSGRILVENVTGSFKTGAKPLSMASSPSSGITSDVVTTVSGVQYLGEADINDDIFVAHFYPNWLGWGFTLWSFSAASSPRLWLGGSHGSLRDASRVLIYCR